MHSLVYKKIQDAQARSKLANEMMIYHMKVTNINLQPVFLLLLFLNESSLVAGQYKASVDC